MNQLREGVLLNSNDMNQALTLESAFGRVSLFSEAAPVESRKNEDACGSREFEHHLLLVLADGLGGHKNGSVASEIVVNNLVKNWERRESFSLEKLIHRIECSHAEIKELKTGAGSTVVAAIIENTNVRFVSVGDSSGFMFSGHKNFKFKTLEHSPTGFAVEAGLLNEKDALDHEESHIILNALGHDPLRLEVTGKMELSERDFVVLATDGLTSNLLVEEFSDCLANRENFSPLDQIAEKVKDKMVLGGHPDDLSMALFTK